MELKAVLDRIERRLRVVGLSATAASRAAGLSEDAIRNVRRAVEGRTIKQRGVNTTTLAALAPVLRTTLAWLAEEIGPEEEAETTSVTHVPLLSWVSAGQMSREDAADEALGSIPMTNLPHGDWIALDVKGTSMDRISPPDSLIFVNRRDKHLVPNACYVIGDVEGYATYKRYRPDPMRFEPVSTFDHPTIFPDQEPIIVGRVKISMIRM